MPEAAAADATPQTWVRKALPLVKDARIGVKAKARAASVVCVKTEEDSFSPAGGADELQPDHLRSRPVHRNVQIQPRVPAPKRASPSSAMVPSSCPEVLLPMTPKHASPAAGGSSSGALTSKCPAPVAPSSICAAAAPPVPMPVPKKAPSQGLGDSWPAVGQVWPLPDGRSCAGTGLPQHCLRLLPLPARRAVSGGKTTRSAVQVLCSCVGCAAELGEAAVLPLRRLYALLWSSCAADVQEWMHEAAVHPALVHAMGCPEPHGQSIAVWACHVIGRACYQHSRNAVAMAEAGVAACLRGLLKRYSQDAEILTASTTALEYLAHCPEAHRKLSATGTIGLLLEMVEGQIKD